MIDQGKLDEASRIALRHGWRILQGVRLAPDDRDHIAALLYRMRPGRGEHWIDIGCGFGEPARIMRALRPDLQFTLVNNNAFQLLQVPDDIPSAVADMHELPYPEATFAGAMFLWSLCHRDDLGLALREAARVVRPGGALFVFDFVRLGGSNDLTQRILAATFDSPAELKAAAETAGWTVQGFEYPTGDPAIFRAACGTYYDRLTEGLRPAIWWARRT